MSELFLSVGNASVMGFWTVLIVLALRLILKKAPAWFKCTLWGVVGLRLVWPFRLESSFSLIPSTQTLPPEQLFDVTPELQTGFAPLDNAINPVFTQIFESGATNSVNPLQVVIWVAANIWLLGIAVMGIYALVSWLRLRRQTAVSAPVQEGIYICDGIKTPFVLGIIRPKIYLPSNLPEEKWESILAHEYAHLKRRDHWWKPLGFALLAVHWFNPMLWLAYILLCRDMEVASDQRVIRDMTAQEKQTYSETLLECSVETGRVSACPLAFGETGVKQRIKEVLHYKKPALWILITSIVVGAVAAVCFLTSPPVSSDLPRATMLEIKSFANDQIYAVDMDGTYWRIDGEYKKLNIGDRVWIHYDGKPKVVEENPNGKFVVRYVVKPTRLWNKVSSDKLELSIGRDICFFDIDGDGVEEECIIASNLILGNFPTQELSVWNGDVCEVSVQFYRENNDNNMSFFSEDGKLKLLTTESDFKTDMRYYVVYDIEFRNGRLVISMNGKEMDYKAQ